MHYYAQDYRCPELEGEGLNAACASRGYRCLGYIDCLFWREGARTLPVSAESQYQTIILIIKLIIVIIFKMINHYRLAER